MTLHSTNSSRPVNLDEIYTRFADIENEVSRYREHFQNKVVLCNCNDPFESNFFKYFAVNFNNLELKKLIAISRPTSSIKGSELPIFGSSEKLNSMASMIVLDNMRDMNQDNIIDIEDVKEFILSRIDTRIPLTGNGDFRSYECMDILQEADIAVTHPPYSLFREYLELMFNFRKKFLLLGSASFIIYKDVFSQLQSGAMHLGSQGRHNNMEFQIAGSNCPTHNLVSIKNMCWFTNLMPTGA